MKLDQFSLATQDDQLELDSIATEQWAWFGSGGRLWGAAKGRGLVV
jgi:hypothetical protein